MHWPPHRLINSPEALDLVQIESDQKDSTVAQTTAGDLLDLGTRCPARSVTETVKRMTILTAARRQPARSTPRMTKTKWRSHVQSVVSHLDSRALRVSASPRHLPSRPYRDKHSGRRNGRGIGVARLTARVELSR